jgi:hypothetical protein
MESMMEQCEGMPMALRTQRNGKVKISEANAWRMLSNTTTNRDTAVDLRHDYITTLKKLRQLNKGMDFATVGS